MSSGSSRLCTRLCATRLPSPWAQVLTLAEAGRGSPLKVKVGCQLGVAHDEEATSALPRATGWGPLTDSWIVILPKGWGGVFAGTSLRTLCDWSAVSLSDSRFGEKEDYGP